MDTWTSGNYKYSSLEERKDITVDDYLNDDKLKKDDNGNNYSLSNLSIKWGDQLYSGTIVKNVINDFCKDFFKDNPIELNNLKGNSTENLSKLCKKLKGVEGYEDCRFSFKLGERIEGVNDMGNKEKKISKIIEEVLGKNKQVIFTGAPGTGKTYSVRKHVEKQCPKKVNEETQPKEKRYEFVQFHSSYDYTDFVEGLRPVCIGEDKTPTFIRMDGIFKAFCRQIVRNKIEEPCYFIIDEINRADIGKVFGELMFGLEEDYRGDENKFRTQYANLPTYEIKNGIAEKIEEKEDVFNDGFYIPKNLYIIGTMNDIDRSVETFDFALRRRFIWVEIKANEIMESSLKAIFESKEIEANKLEELIQKAKNLNECISGKDYKFGLNETYHIGPAYFKDYDGTNLEDIWNRRIEPLLKEYVRGRNSEQVENFIDGCKKTLLGDDNDSKDGTDKASQQDSE